MKKFFNKLYSVILYLGISFTTFVLMAYIIAFVFGLYSQINSLTTGYLIIFIVFLIFISLVFWFITLKKYNSNRFKMFLSLVVVLFIIFNVLFSSSIIKKGDVGSYRDGDIVLTYRFNYYPYKVLPKDTVVIFGNSAGNWDPLIGMIISVPGETFLDRTLLTDTYLIALSNQEVVIERNQILSIVVGKLYRDD